MSHPRIAVIGTGTVGAQVLWQLSQRDCEVVGYELFEPGHSRGAASGDNRIFNFVELEDLRFVPITERADELYKELEAEAGVQLRDLRGVLAIGEADAEPTRIAIEAAKLQGERFQILSTEEARAKFPKYDIRDDEIVLLDLDGGIIFPERTIQSAAGLAVENGAELRSSSRVIGIEQRSAHVVVTTEDGQEDTFDRVVVAAGAWTSKLLPDMAPYLAMRRLISTWFQPKFRESMEGLLPYVRAEPNYSYGLPSPDGASMKVGLGFRNHLAIESPDTTEYTLSEEELVPLRAIVQDLIPSLDSYPIRVGVCHEGYTWSRIEYVQPHPGMSNVLVMAGFSGKGFKNSPALGEIGARWAEGLDAEPHAQFLFDLEHQPFDEN